jgi:signal transduction histidine kinase
MSTTFAPEKKAAPEELKQEIEMISTNPVMSGLLQSIGGLLAILDEHRQIIAMNHTFLDLLGIEDASLAMGLRLGEALGCVHAHDGPGHTCGSTRYCSTCGAAIAMVASLKSNAPEERICALSAHRKGQPIELSLRVRCQPVQVEDQRFLLIFLQDITQQQQWAALERTFFHDIQNMLGMLSGASDLLVLEQPSELATAIQEASERLIREVAIQQCLSASKEHTYHPQWHEYPLARILKELRSFFANHAVAKGKFIEFPAESPDVILKTDLSLVSRVLSNMILNALEATESGGLIRVDVDSQPGRVIFSVWNRSVIPPGVAARIFQRNFSTKEEAGRGIGTFSMKLFGEQMLRGLVDFSSTEDDGTTFRLTLHA